jgi:hypothetical protein
LVPKGTLTQQNKQSEPFALGYGADIFLGKLVLDYWNGIEKLVRDVSRWLLHVSLTHSGGD